MVHRKLRIAAAIAAVALLAVVTVFVFWAADAAPADETALSAMDSDSQVFVSAEKGWVIFFPAQDPRPGSGFIFYPGGKVDYRAYAPVLKLIAARGYFVALIPVPLNMAVFNVNGAAHVQAAYPEIDRWFVGGHSLGGVAAGSFADGRRDISGVVFWASAPGNDALVDQDLPVLLVYAANDGLFSLKSVEDARASLPASAEFISIAGGNHAQFGSYGSQSGDNPAAISPGQQWAQVAGATVEFFDSVLK